MKASGHGEHSALLLAGEMAVEDEDVKPALFGVSEERRSDEAGDLRRYLEGPEAWKLLRRRRGPLCLRMRGRGQRRKSGEGYGEDK
jgi:hypothetical protein